MVHIVESSQGNESFDLDDYPFVRTAFDNLNIVTSRSVDVLQTIDASDGDCCVQNMIFGDTNAFRDNCHKSKWGQGKVDLSQSQVTMNKRTENSINTNVSNHKTQCNQNGINDLRSKESIGDVNEYDSKDNTSDKYNEYCQNSNSKSENEFDSSNNSTEIAIEHTLNHQSDNLTETRQTINNDYKNPSYSCKSLTSKTTNSLRRARYSNSGNISSTNCSSKSCNMPNQTAIKRCIDGTSRKFLTKKGFEMNEINQEDKNFINSSKKLCFNEKFDLEIENSFKKDKQHLCMSEGLDNDSFEDIEVNGKWTNDSSLCNTSVINFDKMSNSSGKENKLMIQSENTILTLSKMKNTDKALIQESSKFKKKIGKLQEELSKIKKKRILLDEKEQELKSSYVKLTIKMKQRGISPIKSIFSDLPAEGLETMEKRAVDTLLSILRQDESSH